MSYSTTCQNEVTKTQPTRTTWLQNKTDLCLYPVVFESLISIFLCKYCFNSKVSVVFGGAERILETTRCIVSIWNNILHIMKAYRGIVWANSKPQVPTAPQQQWTWMEAALQSSGVGQSPQTDGFLVQNVSCRKVCLRVSGKRQNMI